MSAALVVKLPKQPGSREHRWVHLLCGEAGVPVDQGQRRDADVSHNVALEERVSRLEQEVAELRAELRGALGALSG